MTVPCSVQCAPFKISPATYATCCKQHAATAAAAKPKAKPAVLKSRFPKPLTTGQLQQGQVKFVDDIGSSDAFKTLREQISSNDPSTAPPPSPPTTNQTSTMPAPSGGGSTATGATIYKTKGRAFSCVDSIGCNCKKGVRSVRQDCSNGGSRWFGAPLVGAGVLSIAISGLIIVRPIGFGAPLLACSV